MYWSPNEPGITAERTAAPSAIEIIASDTG